jgi:hypothetical protein
MRLPSSVQEIADVIGRERALYLVGRLPRYLSPDVRTRETCKGGHSTRVIMYVPKRMTFDHELVRILGWNDAEKLRVAFGGEILKPAVCGDLYKPFRDAGIRRAWAAGGVTIELLAEWFSVNPKTIKNVLAGIEASENPQEGIRAANDDSAAGSIRRAG